jgi:hypothetical protein
LTSEETAFMKQKPPDIVGNTEDRQEWVLKKNQMSTAIVRRLKQIVHMERGKLPKEKESSSCKLGAIGDLLKKEVLHIKINATSTSTSKWDITLDDFSLH